MAKKISLKRFDREDTCTIFPISNSNQRAIVKFKPKNISFSRGDKDYLEVRVTPEYLQSSQRKDGFYVLQLRHINALNGFPNFGTYELPARSNPEAIKQAKTVAESIKSGDLSYDFRISPAGLLEIHLLNYR